MSLVGLVGVSTGLGGNGSPWVQKRKLAGCQSLAGSS